MPTFEQGDMWSAFDESDLFLITTTNTVKSNGALVMGRGIAKEAKERLPKIDKLLGWQIRHQSGQAAGTPHKIAVGNFVGYPAVYGLLIPLNWPEEKVGALQVKEKYDADADLAIIGQSVKMLLKWARAHPTKRIDLNFPGIGAGRLPRGSVLPLLLHLPDNVHIWEHPTTRKEKAKNKTMVVNIRQTPQIDVYIGRPGHGEDGYFGNPITHSDPCPVCGEIHSGHGETLPCYKQWLWDRVNHDSAFRARLWALKGKVLGCFCKPHPCHGDVIVAWLDAGGPYRDGETLRRMADGPAKPKADTTTGPVLAVTGHRPKVLGYGPAVQEALARTALAMIDHYQPSKVITGMAQGWDMAVAVACLTKGVPFTAAIPFQGQELKWPADVQALYHKVVEKADEVVVVSEGGYSAAKMHARNHWMVDHADQVVALYNGEAKGGTWACVQYTASINKPLKIVWDHYLAQKERIEKKQAVAV